MAECVEIVRIRPKPGSEDKLKEIRPRMTGDTRNIHGGVVTTILAEADDGTWVDIWVWESREAAQRSLDRASELPGFVEWGEHVDVEKFEMYDVSDRT